MGRYRIYLLVALAIALVTAATMSLNGAKRYYPLVRAHMPDNITLVFADMPWTDAEKCRAAEQRMVETLRQNCSQCRIEEGCATQLDSKWQKALLGEAIDLHVVQSGTLRVAIDAGAVSRQLCDTMVAEIGKGQEQPVRCVAPQ